MGIWKAQHTVGCLGQFQAQNMMGCPVGGKWAPGPHAPCPPRSSSPSTPSPVRQVQRCLHSSPQELERQALAKHVRAEALSSTLRLAQDEALRAKNLLLTDKMKPE